MWLPRFLTDPEIDRHLLIDEGEVVIDEVRKHWIAYLPAVGGFIGGAFLFGVFLVSRPGSAWLPLLLTLSVFGWTGYRAARAHLDRFVITNMRVFRIKGVFARSVATMPLARILDITVIRPLLGRMLGYGHFIFETAAQDQGLRDITFVGRPYERDLVIQRVVQRAGLRQRR